MRNCRAIARGFGSLLREIVETIDRSGLKRHHLRKHRRAAERFLERGSLYALLHRGGGSAQEEDWQEPRETVHFPGLRGVPWNNNNAEHAVRAFTRLRNTMASSTAKGTADSASCSACSRPFGTEASIPGLP